MDLMSQERNSTGFYAKARNRCPKIPRRYIMALLMFLGFFLLYWMRLNYTIAIFNIIINGKTNVLYPKEHKWEFEDILYLHVYLMWANAAAQIPGAFLAMIFPPHRMFFLSVALSSVAHFFWPLAVNYNLVAATTTSLLQGILEGPLYPSFFGMITQWAPMAEKSRLLTLALAGRYFGTFVGYPLSDTLVSKLGAEIGFYSSAIGGLLWCVLWAFYAFESPSQDPYITQEELHYLQNNIATGSKVPVTVKSIPIRSILLSLPVWSICLATMWYKCIEYIVRFIPQMMAFRGHGYGNEYHHLILLAFLPDICSGLLFPVFGFLSDFLISRNLLDITKTRRGFVFVAFMGIAFVMIVASLLQQSVAVTILIHVSTIFFAMTTAGVEVNYLDICPRHAVFISGCVAAMRGVAESCFPFLVECIIDMKKNLHSADLKILMYIACSISIIIASLFAIFSSGVQQSWDKAANPIEDVVNQGKRKPEVGQSFEDDVTTLIPETTLL